MTRIIDLADGTSSASAPTTTAVPTTATNVSYSNATSGLVATNAQTAIDEVEGRVDDLETDVAGHETRIDDLEALGPMSYRGTWNASTNTPTLTSSVGTKGYAYRVSVAGTTNLDGIASWAVGDFAVYNGTTWDKWDTTDLVSSVNGATGVVVLGTDEIAEGVTNLYHTTTRARTAAVVNSTAGSETDQAPSVSAIKSYVLANSGSGVPNFIANPGFEADTSGWAAYADAAATTPADATGGSPNVTITRNTTTPLVGTADGLITKDAANRQGQGVSYAFTSSAGYSSMPVLVEVTYKTSAGYASNDIRVGIYNVTGAANVAAINTNLKASTAGAKEYFFISGAASSSFRLWFHIASTSATAYTVNIDNVRVFPHNNIYAFYKTSAGQAVTSGNVIDFGTQVYDSHSRVTTGASWVFTADRAGMYTVLSRTTTASLTPGATTQTYGNDIYVNGSRVVIGSSFPALITTARTFSGNTASTVFMEKGDTLDIRFNEDIPAVNLAAVADNNYIIITGGPNGMAN
jgi:hypothetical protein